MRNTRLRAMRGLYVALSFKDDHSSNDCRCSQQHCVRAGARRRRHIDLRRVGRMGRHHRLAQGIGSRKAVNCTFAPSVPGPVEYYTGAITKVGVDIGATTASVMVWLVYAPTSRPLGGLQGSYVGATGEATFGVGAGANVLIGGSNRTVSLQPVSVQGQTGLNVAGGVAELDLRFVR